MFFCVETTNFYVDSMVCLELQVWSTIIILYINIVTTYLHQCRSTLLFVVSDYIKPAEVATIQSWSSVTPDN